MPLFSRKKKRKHPIRRDSQGQSLRRQAFGFFDGGYRPAQIYHRALVDCSMKTLLRYFEDWKKENHIVSYKELKKELKELPWMNERLLGVIAGTLGISKQEVVARMQKPWGLKQFLGGNLLNLAMAEERSEVEARLDAALNAINFADRMYGNPPKVIARLLSGIINMPNKSTIEISKDDNQIAIKATDRTGATTTETLLYNPPDKEKK